MPIPVLLRVNARSTCYMEFLLPSQVARLAALCRQLGEQSVSVLIDNASQLNNSTHFSETGLPAGAYLKVDTGYHHVGHPPSSHKKDNLIAKLMKLEDKGKANLIGLYPYHSLGIQLHKYFDLYGSVFKYCGATKGTHIIFLASDGPI